jgi:predicted amidohydrolase YtcJ
VRDGGYFAGLLDAPGAPATRAGGLLLDPTRVERAVDEAHRAGFQVAIAATGEAAIGVAIRSFERALQRAPAIDHRHRIEICAQPTLAQLDRIADLGISVVVQPVRLLTGAPPGAASTPLRRMLERGILVAAGSGCPAAPLDPIATVAAACMHPNEAERLTAAEALALCTSDAARVAFEESDRGTLTAGKRADLVVLSQSPLAVPPEGVGRIRVEQVWLGGVEVEAQSLSVSRYVLGSLAGRLREAIGLVD